MMVQYYPRWKAMKWTIKAGSIVHGWEGNFYTQSISLFRGPVNCVCMNNISVWTASRVLIHETVSILTMWSLLCVTISNVTAYLQRMLDLFRQSQIHKQFFWLSLEEECWLLGRKRTQPEIPSRDPTFTTRLHFIFLPRVTLIYSSKGDANNESLGHL
jgi:hypothetical protein